MPLSPSVSMMNGLQPVPSSQSHRVSALPPRKRPPRPVIRPLIPNGSLRGPNEVAVSKLPPPLKTSRYVQNGKLKISISRSNASDDLNDRRSMSHESSYVSRSPSPAQSHSTYRSSSSLSNYDTWRSSDSSRSRNTPRRQFPQSYTDHSLDVHEFYQMEQSPVVYDANLSFMLGMKQPLRQTLRVSPAHSEKSTASNYLSSQISNFLKRTDHVMEEWSAMGCKRDDTVSYIERQREAHSMDRFVGVGRSKSATNILVRGFQLMKSQPSSLRRSVSRDINNIPSDQLDDDDRTVCDEEVRDGKHLLWLTTHMLLIRNICVTGVEIFWLCNIVRPWKLRWARYRETFRFSRDFKSSHDGNFSLLAVPWKIRQSDFDVAKINSQHILLWVNRWRETGERFAQKVSRNIYFRHAGKIYK